jgi:hypothetical protein
VPQLVLDEQLCGRGLIDALRARGLAVATVKDFGAGGRPDPDVVRRIDERCDGPWVLITMDFTIVEDFPGFDWIRYAIAWVVPREELRGGAFQHEKNDIVHRHVHQMVEHGRGDHHTYTVKQHQKSRPSLASQLRRRL